ncbi:hypothetical protein GCM10022224_075230 [Nonomuraea antimicrobica]|uniref:Uncharacterized protein n=1 Tax=Nonomuraea antimicrobica TaxID=561173 RepID=A0ABP7D1S9_9ACTN
MAPIVVPDRRTILLMLPPEKPDSSNTSAAARRIRSRVRTARSCLGWGMAPHYPPHEESALGGDERYPMYALAQPPDQHGRRPRRRSPAPTSTFLQNTLYVIGRDGPPTSHAPVASPVYTSMHTQEIR